MTRLSILLACLVLFSWLNFSQAWADSNTIEIKEAIGPSLNFASADPLKSPEVQRWFDAAEAAAQEEFQSLRTSQPYWPKERYSSLRSFPLHEAEPFRLKVCLGNPPSTKLAKWVEEAFSQWSKALNGKLDVAYVTDASQAHIYFHWRKHYSSNILISDLRSTISNFHQKAGETYPGIGLALINIETYEHFDYPEQENLIQSVILHEVGHALGLTDHATQSTQTIMSPSVGRYDLSELYRLKPKLGKHDIEAIQLLYSDRWKPGQTVFPQ